MTRDLYCVFNVVSWLTKNHDVSEADSAPFIREKYENCCVHLHGVSPKMEIGCVQCKRLKERRVLFNDADNW